MIKQGIAFFGQAGSGKTTLAANLAAFKGGVRLSFADFLRKEYSIKNNIPIRTLTTVPYKYAHRAGLQRLGDELRAADEDIFVKQMQAEIERQMGFGRRVFLVDDVRRWNEYKLLKGMGFHMVRVEGHQSVLSASEANHISETEWREFEYDVNVPWIKPTLMNDAGSEKRAIYERLAYLYLKLDGDIVEWNRAQRLR